MYSIKFDMENTRYNKVIEFLSDLNITNIEIKKSDRLHMKYENSIIDFLQSSPLIGLANYLINWKVIVHNEKYSGFMLRRGCLWDEPCSQTFCRVFKR